MTNELKTSTWWAIQDSTSPADIGDLPRGAQTALSTYAQARSKAVAKAKTDVASEKSKAAKRLEAIQVAETKRGNTAGALAVKGRADELLAAARTATATKPPAPKAAEPAEPHSSKDVILYALPDFKGSATIIRQVGSIINVAAIGFPSDGLRSIKVPLGMTVTVFENEDGGGNMLELTHDVANLMGTKALGTTSLMITRKK